MRASRHSRNGNAGFSLLELLIVVAIIGILMAMYMKTFSKVYRHVKTESAHATMNQTANVSSALVDEHPSMADCRRDFFQKIGKNEFMCMLYYRADTEEEFIAYWHTLLNPNTDVDASIEHNKLVATHPNGTIYKLEHHMMRWSFVAYKEGGVEPQPFGVDYHNPETGKFDFMRFPSEFPATPIVAGLSYQFLEDYDLLDEY